MHLYNLITSGIYDNDNDGKLVKPMMILLIPMGVPVVQRSLFAPHNAQCDSLHVGDSQWLLNVGHLTVSAGDEKEIIPIYP